MAVLRVTSFAVENIVTGPVYHLRALPSLAPCQSLVWQHLPFIAPRPSLELPFATPDSCLRASLQRDGPSSQLLANLRVGGDGLRTAAQRKQPALSRVPLIHGGASLAYERPLGTHSHFVCSASADGAEVSEKLPVGLVLPNAEPAHEPVTLPQVTEGGQLQHLKSPGHCVTSCYCPPVSLLLVYDSLKGMLFISSVLR